MSERTNFTAAKFACALVLTTVGFADTARAAATITIVNTNGAGVGFNDTTVVTTPDAGCTVGEAIGTCRLRVFSTAASQWGTLLNSSVEIRVDASMIPQTCSGTSAVLGSAGPQSSFANFANAPRPNTAYVVATANSLAGTDLSAGNDITANFNISFDNGSCLTGTAGWWYGTDPGIPAPANRASLLPVVFHELGHGLGFTAGVNPSSGAFFTGSTPSVWSHYLYDTETSQRWVNMSNAQRVASAINDPDLVWSGRLTNVASPSFLGPPARAIVNSPAIIAGSYEAQAASFGPSVETSPATADVALVNDGVIGVPVPPATANGTVNDGCEMPFTNAAAIVGKIAVVERGFCTFVVKAQNAQASGAVGLLVTNNVASGLPGMGGADPAIVIPALGISQAAGNAIRGQLPAPGVNVRMGLDTSVLSGTRSGCVRMFAPDPVQSGSSVSHFHSDALPNLLMEPSLTGSIFNRVDLTAFLFKDIGWSTAGDNTLMSESFEDGPCAFAP